MNEVSSRRAFLGSVGTATLASLAGCQSLSKDDKDPTFTLESVRAYQPDSGTVIVVGTVEKPEGESGSVTLRSELLVENDYDHAFTQKYSVPGDVGTSEYATPYEYASQFFEERTYEARMKIVDTGGPDQAWVYAGETEADAGASGE